MDCSWNRILADLDTFLNSFIYFWAREKSGPCQKRFFHIALMRRIDPCHPKARGCFSTWEVDVGICIFRFWATGPGPGLGLGSSVQERDPGPGPGSIGLGHMGPGPCAQAHEPGSTGSAPMGPGPLWATGNAENSRNRSTPRPNTRPGAEISGLGHT